MIEYGIVSRQFIEEASLIATDWRLALPESSAFLDKELLHMNEEEKNPGTEVHTYWELFQQEHPYLASSIWDNFSTVLIANTFQEQTFTKTKNQDLGNMSI